MKPDPIEVLCRALKERAADYRFHLQCGSNGNNRAKMELCEELLEELERLTRGQ